MRIGITYIGFWSAWNNWNLKYPLSELKHLDKTFMTQKFQLKAMTPEIQTRRCIDHLNILPEDSFQDTAQQGRTQRESSRLPQLRRDS